MNNTKIQYIVTKVIYLTEIIEAYDENNAVKAFNDKYNKMSKVEYIANINQSESNFDVQENV